MPHNTHSMYDDLLAAMVELGLTSSEARVYLAAVELGGATTKEIATAADKERSNTHHLLQRLEQLGLVEATLDSPTKFKPIEPKEAVDHLFNFQAVKFRKLEEMRKSVVTNLFLPGTKLPSDGETFSVIKGRVRTYLRMVDTLSRCNNEVCLLMSSNGLIRLSHFRDFVQVMEQKAKAGVKFRVITEITKSNAEDARRIGKLAELRHIRNQSTNASIYDMKVGSVALAINEGLIEDVPEHVALWSNGEPYVKMLATFFDSVWFLAAPMTPTLKSMGMRP